MPTFDPISGAPISSLGAYLSQEVAQSLGLSDSLGLLVDHNVSVEQTIGVSHSVGLNTIYTFDVEDSLSITDSVILSMIYVRDISDTYTLTDEVAVQIIDNTEPYATLSLSHAVAVKQIKTIVINHTLALSDLGLRNLHESITHSLSFTQTLEKLTPELYGISTLTFSHLAKAKLTLSLPVVQSLSLTHLLYRNLPKSLTQSLALTGVTTNRVIPYINIIDTIGVNHSVDAITNLDPSNVSTLVLTQMVSLTILPKQSLIQSLLLTQAVDVENFIQHNLASSLTMIGEAAYTLFEQQDMISLLTLSHVITPRNLAKQDDPNTLHLSHSVSVVVSSTGPKSVSNTLNLQHSVALGQVKYFEICDCLTLTNSVHKAIELDVEHDLTLSQYYMPGQPEHELNLSHTLESNIVIDECCGTVRVPDKVVKNTLVLTHSVSVNQGAVPSVTSMLALSHSAAYYKL